MKRERGEERGDEEGMKRGRKGWRERGEGEEEGCVMKVRKCVALMLLWKHHMFYIILS